ncbi:hypothetical protein BGZ94_008518 [Podila epigama]|nr:hypothetical protein BGZ94_008518 [Podila epigama]
MTRAENLFETSWDYFDFSQYRFANARYWHSKLRAELNDLEKAGVLSAVHQTREDEMLDDLKLLEERAKESDYKNWADETLREKHHLSDHPGYDLLRPQEFFQRYGDYALRVLRVVQSGFSDYDIIIPPLETFEILSGHSSSSSEQRLCKDTLAQLVSKSIAYLEKLGLPQKERLGLAYQEILGIKDYLAIEHDEEGGLGDLFRQFRTNLSLSRLETSSLVSSWVCQEHFQQEARIDAIEEIRQFVVEDCGGKIDVQQGFIQVELSSEMMAQKFVACFRECDDFDLSIKLTWPATRKFLKEFISTLFAARRLWLELDGVTMEAYPEGFVEYEADLLVAPGQRFLTLLNYPRHGQQCTIVDKTSFQSPMPDRQHSPFCWIRGALIERSTRDQDDGGRGAREEGDDKDDHLQKTIQKMTAITGDDLPQVNWTRTRGGGMVEMLHLKSGTIDLHLTKDTVPSYPSAKSRFLRQLTVEENIQVRDPDFVALLQRSPHLEELNVATRGECPLKLAEYLIETCHNGSNSLLVTLFERPMDRDEQSQIVVQLAIGAFCSLEDNSPNVTGADNNQGNGKSMVRPRSYFENIECRQWNNDVAMTPSTLEQALLLDQWTKVFPLSLKCFTFDISSRSLEILVVLQSILRRSRLGCLHISCRPIDPSFQETVRHVLESIEWPSIQFLVLDGESIEPWVELLATIYEQNTDDTLPLYLAIEDTSFSPSPLSHSGALALHQLLYSRSSDDVQLRNIEFQDEKDQLFVMDAFGVDASVIA